MKAKKNKSTQVRELLEDSILTAAQIAKKVGCSVTLVKQIHKKMRTESDDQVKADYAEKVGGNPIPDFLKPQEDMINNPPHYSKGIQPIDAIEEWQLNYRLGNVVKYLARCNFKGNYLEDLKKAQWYLHREITNVRWKEVEKE